MGIADELQKLDALRAGGALTEGEYAQAKRRVLDGPAGPPPTPLVAAGPNVLQRFTRSATDAWLGGVCGGLAAITPVPSWAWRLVFCVAAFVYGVGLVPYVLMWILVPAAGSASDR